MSTQMWLLFVIIGICTKEIYGQNQDPYDPLRNRQSQRQTQPRHCAYNQFHCIRSKECISADKVCDGAIDCYDRTDETYQKCSENSCEEFSFKCSYGACIDRDLICDGKNDCADGSDESASECTSNLNRPNTCSPLEFTCDTGECIPEASLCDGTADCSNGYDESREQCHRNKCEDYSFRCNYGACIDDDMTCNGKDDCFDGSDESPQLCRRQTTETEVIRDGCSLPRAPRYGGYKIRFGSQELKGTARQLVPIGSYLQFFCGVGYKLSPQISIVLCQDNKTWSNVVPKCVVECPRLSSLSQDITYSVPDGAPLFPGTTAALRCKPAYEQPNNDPHYRHISCLPDGSWSRSVYNCTPKCGLEASDAHTLIINGEPAKAIQYPWNVGIYRSNPQYKEDHIHICGGTIISERLIISAAHCFYNATSESASDPSIYSIGAGKYYRKWSVSKQLDPYQQKRQISQIIIKEGYKGVFSSYLNDIAILILESENAIIFNEFVRPACIDWDNQYENKAFQKDVSGVTVGWGLTSTDGTRSTTLKKISLPYIPRHPDCYDSVPENFRRFLIDDKICAGHLNGSSVCEGDSGSGLLFQNTNTRLWYLRALVSIDPAVGISCNQYSYTAFTRVSYYLNWISDYFARIV